MQLSDARVLVVDDNSILRELFVAWLRRVAASVREAQNGADAIQKIARHDFDLIVTDIRMPVLDGLGLLGHLRVNSRPMPVVLCVSGNIDVKLPELYDLGAAALLEKPVNRDEFLEAARRSMLTRDELWQMSAHLGSSQTCPAQTGPERTASARSGERATLTTSYGSLAQAVREKRVAFGWGGLCVATDEPLGKGAVDLELSFAQDRLLLSGQGVVRWTAHGMAGIELEYLAEECRARVKEEVGGKRAFIPNLGCMAEEQAHCRGKDAAASVFSEFVVGAAGFEPATSTV